MSALWVSGHLGRFPFCQSFRLESSETYRGKWRGFFPSRFKLEMSLVDQKNVRGGAMIDARKPKDGNGNFVQMEPGFSFQLVGTEKLEYLQTSSLCFGKFAFYPRLSSTFQSVSKPKSLTKWNGAPVITTSR